MASQWNMSVLAAIATLFLFWSNLCLASLQANETTSYISVSSERLQFKVSKENGDLYDVFFDDVNLLGTRTSTTGRGYLICYCTSEDVLTSAGEHLIGESDDTEYTLINDYDRNGTHFIGIKLLETLATGQTFTWWWFIRDGEPALHQFTRMTYNNETVPYLTTFGEYRYLFRPNTDTNWTHLSVNAQDDAPLPSKSDLATEVKVQDSGWIFPNSTSAYSKAVGNYFTKYIFADSFDLTHKAHGIYLDPSVNNGHGIGAWQLFNTRDTYYGGPKRFDLLVDGAVYNKWSTSHYGGRTANITDGFDRTFGPQALYFNGGDNSTLAELKADAYSRANEEWQSDFYDYIGEKYIPTYVRKAQRGKLVGSVNIPNGTLKSQAILAQNGVDYADNVGDQKAHQHWTNVDLETGQFEIDRVAAGTYRLTITFEGKFGDFHVDNVTISANETKRLTGLKYQETSHGKELWRIGIPDRTAGEFKHGFQRDQNHTSYFEQYRQLWQAYDFPTEFPNGVTFTVGESNETTDWNYVHWSEYGPTYTRSTAAYGVNNYTIIFNLDSTPSRKETYTFTIVLAGAHGSTGSYVSNSTNVSLDWSLADVHLLTYLNNITTPYDWYIWTGYQSSTAVRCGISGYNLKTTWEWNGSLLHKGQNKIILNLAEDTYSYVQYDALRLEVSKNTTTITTTAA